eukprot:281872_1
MNAIKLYDMSIQISILCDVYMSAYTVQHKHHCLRKIGVGVEHKEMDKSVKELNKCVKIAQKDDEKYKKLRHGWSKNDAISFEWKGVALCALHLAIYHQDKCAPNKYNDQSLVYCKLAMIALEKSECIVLQTVTLKSVVNSFNEQRNILISNSNCN